MPCSYQRAGDWPQRVSIAAKDIHRHEMWENKRTVLPLGDRKHAATPTVLKWHSLFDPTPRFITKQWDDETSQGFWYHFRPVEGYFRMRGGVEQRGRNMRGVETLLAPYCSPVYVAVRAASSFARCFLFQPFPFVKRVFLSALFLAHLLTSTPA